MTADTANQEQLAHEHELAERDAAAFVLVLDESPWAGEPPKKAIGFPERQDKRSAATRARYRSLSEALTATYATDAHFSAYDAPPWLPFRLKKSLFDSRTDGDLVHALKVRRSLTDDVVNRCIECVSMTIRLFVGDVDDPVAHEQRVPARPEWRAAELPKIQALMAAHPGFRAYPSRGGYRPFALIRPRVLRSLSDWPEWQAHYLGLGGYLMRRFGIQVDPRCKDPTRLFRLPYVVRDGVHERPETFGDLRTVGYFDYAPTPDDYEVVRRMAESDHYWRIGYDCVDEDDDSDPRPRAPRAAVESDDDETLPRGEGLKWDLHGEHVEMAMELIAENFPPKQRHDLAMAIAGMIRRAGGTQSDARYIIFESFAAGGSRDPNTRAAVCDDTWNRSSNVYGFTMCKSIVGEEVAKKIGDCFQKAYADSYLPDLAARLRRREEKTTAPGADVSPVTSAPPTPPTDAEVSRLRMVLFALGKKKFMRGRSAAHRSKSTGSTMSKQAVRNVYDMLLLDRMLDGAAIAPVEGVDPETKLDRSAAIAQLAGLLAFKLPTTANFDAVEILAAPSIAKMCKTGESREPIAKHFRDAYKAALVRKLRENK